MMAQDPVQVLHGLRVVSAGDEGKTRRFRLSYPDGEKLSFYATVIPDPPQIFLTCDKPGSLERLLLGEVAHMASKALRRGASLQEVARDWCNTRAEPAGFTGDPKFPTVTSILDYVGRWVLDTFPGVSQ